LALGESLALGFHYWFKNASGLGDRLTLSRGSGATSVFGTAHGLVKLPYMRDTRRSVGVGDFVIKVGRREGGGPGQAGGRAGGRVCAVMAVDGGGGG